MSRLAKHLFDRQNPGSSLRGDALARLLSLADVQPHSKTLVVDWSGGLLLAACLHRQGGFGSVISAHDGNNNRCTHQVSQLAMPKRCKENLVDFPLSLTTELLKNLASSTPITESPPAPAPIPAVTTTVDTNDKNSNSDPTQPQIVRLTATEKARKKVIELTKILSVEETEESKADHIEGRINSAAGVHCIVAACNYEPSLLVEGLLPLLASSGTLAVFSPYAEPLLKLKQTLVNQRLCVSLSLYSLVLIVCVCSICMYDLSYTMDR